VSSEMLQFSINPTHRMGHDATCLNRIISFIYSEMMN